MVECAGMVERHTEGIPAYWGNKTTAAFLETLNSVFSAIKQKARGIRLTGNLIDMLYFAAGKLRIPATP
jgi:transposase